MPPQLQISDRCIDGRTRANLNAPLQWGHNSLEKLLETIARVESEKVLLYLYTLRPFLLSPLDRKINCVNTLKKYHYAISLFVIIIRIGYTMF